MSKNIILLVFLFTSNFSFSQNSSDTQSPEEIVKACLDVISGPKGKVRDWDRFRNLFVPAAQMNAVYHKGDSSFYRSSDLEKFISKGDWYEKNGFYEKQIGIKTDTFSNIAQVFQSYEARMKPDGEIVQRGINCYQLVFKDGRWWIVNLIWDSENGNVRIPEKFLKE